MSAINRRKLFQALINYAFTRERKGRVKKDIRFGITNAGEKVFVIDGKAAYKLEADECFIDAEKIFPKHVWLRSAENLFIPSYHDTRCFLTWKGRSFKTNTGLHCLIFNTESGEEIFIQSSVFDMIDRENVSLCVCRNFNLDYKQHTLVYAYQDDNCIAVFMPVKVN